MGGMNGVAVTTGTITTGITTIATTAMAIVAIMVTTAIAATGTDRLPARVGRPRQRNSTSRGTASAPLQTTAFCW